MKLALRIGILVAAAFVASMLIWQGATAHGTPDPLRPNTSSTVAFLDIGILVFREGLECILVLAAITGRIGEWGTTPNKMAALGENVILATNLAWTAWLLVEFIRGRTPFTRIEQWQTRYIGVYALWAWVVVLVFPPLFNFM